MKNNQDNTFFKLRKILCEASHKYFKSLKSSGSNIEDTHLTDLDRIEKLFTVVMLAFTWAYIVVLIMIWMYWNNQ